MTTYRPIGVIKTTPENFVVQELVGPDRTPVPLHDETVILGRTGDAPVTVFHLVKRDMTTQLAMKEVAYQLGTSVECLSNYGLKDRHALTAQCIGVEGAFRSAFRHARIVLHQIGSQQNRLIPGRHAGNRFSIDVVSDAEHVDAQMLQPYRNVFGHQRFGTQYGHIVGKLLLEGDHKAAADLERSQIGNRRTDPFSGCGDEWDRIFYGSYAFETSFRVQQWQSHLWNSYVSSLAHPPEKIPVWTERSRHLYREIWDPSNVDPRAARFLHQFNRRTIARPENVSVIRTINGWRIGFDLMSGAYATVALSQIFQLAEERYTESSRRARA